MRITTWAEYGLIVSIRLARSTGKGTLAARVIAEHEQLPADYVEQILLKLRRAGLVSSVRGAKGGYRLAALPETITVRDVIQATEGHLFEVNCDVRPVDGARCGPESDCTLRPVWRALEQRIDSFLDSVSLADLLVSEEDVERMMSVAAIEG